MSDRPTGKDEVVRALKQATLVLLREKGPHFSVREVADHAGVNQGLIYRHFGSKDELISAAAADVTEALSSDLRTGVAPLDLLVDMHPDTATLLARLVLDNSTALITEHPVLDAMIAQAGEAGPGRGPSPETRVAVANATLLGWSLFRRYLVESIGDGVDDGVDGLVGRLIEELLAGPWPGDDPLS